MMRQLTALAILAAVVTGIVMLFMPDPERVPDTADSTPEEVALASESGRKAGLAVALTRQGTMERENAILEIRALESEIRAAGFPTAADSFAAAARRAMELKGVI